jgi:hypothetical protein
MRHLTKSKPRNKNFRFWEENTLRFVEKSGMINEERGRSDAEKKQPEHQGKDYRRSLEALL